MDNLFFFRGEEDFLINHETEKIKSKNIDKTFEAMSYKRLNNPNFDDMINAITAIPMMFGNIMHVIDANNFLLSEGENSIDDWEIKQFEKALQSKSDKNIVVFRCILPADSKKKVDTRKKFYKTLAKYAEEKQFPFFRSFDNQLSDTISELGKNHGLKLSNQIIKLIIDQIGVKLGIINSELEKLAVTIYPETTPKIEDIKNICTQKDDVFGILEAIFKYDFGKALYELKKALEKSSLPEVMAAIQYSLRNYTIIKSNYQKLGKSGLFQKLHIPEFIIEKNMAAMSEFPCEKLFKLKKALIEIEYAIKTGNCANPENALEMTLMGVADV